MSKREKYLLAFIWSAFIVRGVFYSTITPLWEGFDEWSHFAFIQYAQVYHHLPTPGDSRISREIEESFPLVPMPWVLRDMPGIQFTHDTYWRLPAAEQRLLEQHLRHIPREWIRQTARNPVLLYEAQQPPLFYYLFFWPPVASANMPLPERVFLLRYANVILTSFLIPIAYLSAFFVFGDCRRAVGLTAVIAAVPGLGLSVSRVANEGLSIVMCSALLYLLLRVPEECRNFRFMLFLGATVGTALLTKAYILFALPALLTIVLSLLVADRRHAARIVGTTCAALALVVAICGWWYLRIFTITGALSGEQQAAALHDVPVAEILKAIPKVAWNRAIDYACVSHIWVGNWSFLQVRSWMYHVFMYVALVAAVGITILTWRLGLRREMRRRLGVLCVYYGFFWLGMCYHVTITFVASGASVGAGWYLHAVIVSETLLVYLGLTALTPLWLRNFIVPTMCGALLLLDLYATHCILIPYYTGLIAHKVSGALETFQFGRIDAVGISTVLNHLQANRPAFLTPFLIGIIWALFIMLSVGLFIATLWLESKSAASYLRYDNRSEQCQA